MAERSDLMLKRSIESYAIIPSFLFWGYLLGVCVRKRVYVRDRKKDVHTQVCMFLPCICLLKNVFIIRLLREKYRMFWVPIFIVLWFSFISLVGLTFLSLFHLKFVFPKLFTGVNFSSLYWKFFWHLSLKSIFSIPHVSYGPEFWCAVCLMNF